MIAYILPPVTECASPHPAIYFVNVGTTCPYIRQRIQDRNDDCPHNPPLSRSTPTPSCCLFRESRRNLLLHSPNNSKPKWWLPKYYALSRSTPTPSCYLFRDCGRNLPLHSPKKLRPKWWLPTYSLLSLSKPTPSCHLFRECRQQYYVLSPKKENRNSDCPNTPPYHGLRLPPPAIYFVSVGAILDQFWTLRSLLN